MGYKSVYDISVTLGSESIDYPGDTPFSREVTDAVKNGAAYELSKLVMSAHSGTHIDFPSHFIPGGRSASEYQARDFIFPAHVVNITDKESVQPSELEKVDIKPRDALLLRTANSITGACKSGRWSEKYVSMSLEAARLCILRRVGLVGIDYATIEKHGDESFPAHREILGNNILILEGINLEDVPAGKYTLFCFPLKIQNSEACPTRAVLIR